MAFPTPAGARLISAAELLFGSVVVIGHNVYKVLPNEVPVLFVVGWVSLGLRDGRWKAIGFTGPKNFLGWISLILRNGGWKAVGLTRPKSWKRTFLIALALAITLQLLSEYVTVPLVVHWTHRPPDLSEFRSLVGNPLMALLALGLVWMFAAFGEEMVYRGYLLRRAADIGGRTRSAYWIGLAYVTVLFGLGHFYQGWAGVADTAVTSLLFGSAYLLTGRNLWLTILAHGLSDTIAIGLIYFGFFKV